MNKSDLITLIAEKTSQPRLKIEAMVDLIFDNMAENLIKGERVELRGFGSFAVRSYEGYTGRNPKTGESIEVKPKKLPFFKTGKELKTRVDVTKEGA